MECFRRYHFFSAVSFLTLQVVPSMALLYAVQLLAELSAQPVMRTSADQLGDLQVCDRSGEIYTGRVHVFGAKHSLRA